MINDDALVVVEVEHGEYTVFGLLEEEHDVEVGDVLSGPLTALDEQRIVNETKGVTLSVYIEDTELSLDSALERLG
jgi:hypothetical protein